MLYFLDIVKLAATLTFASPKLLWTVVVGFEECFIDILFCFRVALLGGNEFELVVAGKPSC